MKEKYRMFNNDMYFGGRRNVEEWKVISIYSHSTGCYAQLYDRNYQLVEQNKNPGVEQNICCYCSGSGSSGSGCRDLHTSAIREASACGSCHIYRCELGLLFWACPIYNDGLFSGALRGSGPVSPGDGDQTLADKCRVLCNKTIQPEEFIQCVSACSPADVEKIQSLAEMLLLCAESLSLGNENFHEILRLRRSQQDSISVLVEELKKKYPEGTARPSYPLDKERQLISSLRRGDKNEAQKLLNEMLAILVFGNTDHFRYIQLRAMELAVLLVRAGANSGNNTITENNTHYFRQIQDAKTTDEVTEILHCIVDEIAGQIGSFQGIPHAMAMRKAELYIRKNIVRKMSLGEIASVAGLSAPYFSTIFKEEMGENLSRYINRLRVEKASKMLLETDCSLSEIAGICCFEDQSWFSKIFKSFTGLSPGKYRSQGGK